MIPDHDHNPSQSLPSVFGGPTDYKIVVKDNHYGEDQTASISARSTSPSSTPR